jgi:prolyl oligopeptidase
LPWFKSFLAIALLVLGQARPARPLEAARAETEDPYLWLEAVDGPRARAWVQACNTETAGELERQAGFRTLEADLLRILDDRRGLPFPSSRRGKWFYNLWRDADHPRGVWRRTSLEQYREPEPAWETVLDLDALVRAEGRSWVFRDAIFLRPDCRRCLLVLAPGGTDATVAREFDLEAKAFVPDGFQLPLGKSTVEWRDQDTLLVAAAGPGSRTDSGNARSVRLWRRGEPLAGARILFEGRASDVAVFARHDPTPGFQRETVTREMTYYTRETSLLGRDGSLRRIDAPADADLGFHREWLTLQLRSPWTVAGATYPAGALLAARLDDYLAGKRDLHELFRPTGACFLQSSHWTRNCLVLNLLEDVKNRLVVLTPGKGRWTRETVAGVPAMGTLSVYAVDSLDSDDYFLTATGFLTPETLFIGAPGRAPDRLKSAPAQFDATGLRVEQHFALSRDGTRVPYFQVARTGLVLDHSHPTLLTGYGGFEVSELPRYDPVAGHAWLARGGVLAVANIRGGGEYGPRWHQAAVGRNRPRALEDFTAVAQDLVARGVTAPRHLGVKGGSNGGLLVGNMLTQHPDLVHAVVCQAPLLDMKRYSHLLAGASWLDEYGDPDRAEDWEYLKTFSPYQNLEPGIAYPATLLMASSADDRVHPAHARKMCARMKALGCDVRFFESTEGGHGAGADHRQEARFWALAFTFLERQLNGTAPPAGTNRPAG